jgi:tRNA(Ile2) C34 agmatinyltransferase TiaS
MQGSLETTCLAIIPYEKTETKKLIIRPLFPLLDYENNVCYSCGEKASHVGLDGTYTCAKQICMIPLLRRLRTQMDLD